MAAFLAFYGTVTMINDFWTGTEEPSGCYKLMTVQNTNGDIVNFVISPSTYFVDLAMVTIGDQVAGFYDANAPVPMIYPPQYQAIVIAKITGVLAVKVDYFNSQLISSDGMLKLNIAPLTRIIQENGQTFTRNPADHYLIVEYSFATASIPAQTTPLRIIVMCRQL